MMPLKTTTRPGRQTVQTAFGLWAFALLLMLPVSAWSQSGDDILRTSERLLTEERRQLDVRRRISTVVRRIGWLVEDLESNQLIDEGGGQKITKMNEILKALGTKNVPAAASFLREARADLKLAFKPIAGADKEIELILAELDKVIQGSALIDDMLLKQLRHVIRTEEFLRRQTAAY